MLDDGFDLVAFGRIHINRSHGVVHQLARVGADEVATHHLHQFLLLLRRGFVPSRANRAGCPAAEINFGHDIGIHIARHRRFIAGFQTRIGAQILQDLIAHIENDVIRRRCLRH